MRCEWVSKLKRIQQVETATLSAANSKWRRSSGGKSVSTSKPSLAFFSFFYISSLVCIAVFPACLCSETYLSPFIGCVPYPCAPRSAHPQVSYYYSARNKLVGTAFIFQPLLETWPSSLPLHELHFTFSIPVTHLTQILFSSEAFKAPSQGEQ